MNEFDGVIAGEVLTPPERLESSLRIVLTHFAEFRQPILVHSDFYTQHREAIETLILKMFCIKEPLSQHTMKSSPHRIVLCTIILGYSSMNSLDRILNGPPMDVEWEKLLKKLLISPVVRVVLRPPTMLCLVLTRGNIAERSS